MEEGERLDGHGLRPGEFSLRSGLLVVGCSFALLLFVRETGVEEWKCGAVVGALVYHVCGVVGEEWL